MTRQRQCESGQVKSGPISRRTLVGAITASAAIAGSRSVMAQAEKGTPPSVVTSPPRDFGVNAPPNVYTWDPDIVIVDPLFGDYIQGNGPIQRLWTGALWSEGPGLECPRPLSRVERHPEQSPAALARRHRSGQRLSHAVQQQQRQHIRFPGPADFLRASGAARGPLRARRLGDGDRRLVQRQAPQFAQ